MLFRSVIGGREQVGNGWQRAYGGVILRLPNGLFAATGPLALPMQGFDAGFAIDPVRPPHPMVEINAAAASIDRTALIEPPSHVGAQRSIPSRARQ